MPTDNIAGHTAAQNTLGEDGLRDGDSLSPTTLTNLIQGVHGNGILRYQDGAFDSTRNETNSGNQPGSMVRASSSTLTVSGGFVVLDGAVYEFGGGVGNTATVDLNSGSHGSGALALAANEEAIYTIYVAPSGGINKIHYEGGSPVDTSTGLYPSASNQYLINYKTLSSGANAKAIVLAHVRVQYVEVVVEQTISTLLKSTTSAFSFKAQPSITFLFQQEQSQVEKSLTVVTRVSTPLRTSMLFTTKTENSLSQIQSTHSGLVIRAMIQHFQHPTFKPLHHQAMRGMDMVRRVVLTEGVVMFPTHCILRGATTNRQDTTLCGYKVWVLMQQALR